MSFLLKIVVEGRDKTLEYELPNGTPLPPERGFFPLHVGNAEKATQVFIVERQLYLHPETKLIHTVTLKVRRPRSTQKSFEARARRPYADSSHTSALRPSSSPPSTAATGAGGRVQSRSHFSRVARTCSGSTISGFEPKWATIGEGYIPAWPSRDNAPMKVGREGLKQEVHRVVRPKTRGWAFLDWESAASHQRLMDILPPAVLQNGLGD